MAKSDSYYGYSFRVERLTSNQVKIAVQTTKGAVTVLSHTQKEFDIPELENSPDYQKKLTKNLQSFLRQLYLQASPVWICDLPNYQDQAPTVRPMKCGAYTFLCGKEALFAGVIEVLYQMRCTLFHGELAPTKDAIGCYEPAYRLIRRFLECVS